MNNARIRRKNCLKIFVTAAISIFLLPMYAFTLPKTDFVLTIYANDKVYVLGYPDIIPSFGKLKLNDENAITDKIFLDNYTPPENARVLFTPGENQTFSFVPEKYGVAPDKNKLKRDITLALEERLPVAYVEFVKIKPEFCLSDAHKSVLERGRFCTFYGTSSPERKKNIKLAADKINGLVIESGKTFSFNKTVGDRTRENGYMDAKVIVGGKFTDGIGGGVCQVSTTLYNAALLSDITVTERHAHSVAVGYVSPSFDAAVSFGWYDLKLKNDTGGKLYAECRADGENLTFIFYGLENEYDIKRISEVYKKTNPGYETIDDPTGDLCGYADEKILAMPKYEVSSMGKLLYTSKNKSSTGGGRKKSFYVSLGSDKYRGVKGVIAKKSLRG